MDYIWSIGYDRQKNGKVIEKCEDGSTGCFGDFIADVKSTIADPQNINIEIAIDRNYQIKKHKPK